MLPQKETIVVQDHELLLVQDSDGSIEVQSQEEVVSYEIGDHVYRWQSFGGVFSQTQQHGIVVESEIDSFTLALVRKRNALDMVVEEEDAEFCMFRETIPLHDRRNTWNKIAYGVPWTERVFARAGTANPVDLDPVDEVLSRIAFIWNNSALLRNLCTEHTDEKDISECVSVWCKTGRFYSYHGLAKKGHHGADMGSSATLAGSVVSQLVVNAMVPLAAPAILAYDVANAVQSMRATHGCQLEWRRIEWDWNDRYSVTKHLRGWTPNEAPSRFSQENQYAARFQY